MRFENQLRGKFAQRIRLRLTSREIPHVETATTDGIVHEAPQKWSGLRNDFEVITVHGIIPSHRCQLGQKVLRSSSPRASCVVVVVYTNKYPKGYIGVYTTQQRHLA